MGRQLFIPDAVEIDPDPTAHADVRRSIVYLRRRLNQSRLQARRRGNQHRDMPVMVMIAGKHGEDLFADEERRLAVREPFVDSGNAPQIRRTRCRWSSPAFTPDRIKQRRVSNV
jgi:hypothetical protein